MIYTVILQGEEGGLSPWMFSLISILSIIIVVSLLVLFIDQFRKAESEGFKKLGRNLTVVIIGIISIYVIPRSTYAGIMAFKDKYKIGYVIEATNTENSFCKEYLLFRKNGRFIHKSKCEKGTLVHGIYKMKNDTIFIEDTRIKKKKTSFYEFALIGKKEGNSKRYLSFYTSTKDFDPRKFEINHINKEVYSLEN